MVLPHPDGPEQGQELALGDVEVDPLDGLGAVAKTLYHPLSVTFMAALFHRAEREAARDVSLEEEHDGDHGQ